jgi:hypothetical protein
MKMDATKLFVKLEEAACDLRCVNIPTGGDDYDIEWHVIEHYMATPHERIIGRGSTVLEALRSAFHEENQLIPDDLIVAYDAVIDEIITEPEDGTKILYLVLLKELRKHIYGQIKDVQFYMDGCYPGNYKVEEYYSKSSHLIEWRLRFSSFAERQSFLLKYGDRLVVGMD